MLNTPGKLFIVRKKNRAKHSDARKKLSYVLGNHEPGQNGISLIFQELTPEFTRVPYNISDGLSHRYVPGFVHLPYGEIVMMLSLNTQKKPTIVLTLLWNGKQIEGILSNRQAQRWFVPANPATYERYCKNLTISAL
jgi:hypothetical protein